MAVTNTWLIAAMVGTVGFGLYFVDRELASVESKELAAEARSYFERAERASSENRHGRSGRVLPARFNTRAFLAGVSDRFEPRAGKDRPSRRGGTTAHYSPESRPELRTSKSGDGPTTQGRRRHQRSGGLLSSGDLWHLAFRRRRSRFFTRVSSSSICSSAPMRTGMCLLSCCCWRIPRTGTRGYS